MDNVPTDSEPLLQLRRMAKLGQIDDLVKLARQHPDDAAVLVSRMLSISSRTDRLTPKNYEAEIAALRQGLEGRLTQEELLELKALSISRGQELQRRLGLKGLA